MILHGEKKLKPGLGDLAQLFRALAALAEDVMQLITTLSFNC